MLRLPTVSEGGKRIVFILLAPVRLRPKPTLTFCPTYDIHMVVRSSTDGPRMSAAGRGVTSQPLPSTMKLYGAAALRRIGAARHSAHVLSRAS